MAERFTAEEAAVLVFAECTELDSSGESDIEEDPAFPIPSQDDEICDTEGGNIDLSHSQLTLSPTSVSTDLETQLDPCSGIPLDTTQQLSGVLYS